MHRNIETLRLAYKLKFFPFELMTKIPSIILVNTIFQQGGFRGALTY